MAKAPKSQLVATGVELSFCQPLSTPYRYFQVHRVVSPAPSDEVRFDSITVTATEIVLRWSAPAGMRFTVQYSTQIPPQWVPFPGTVTSTTGSYEFTDDGSFSGGTTGFPIYQVLAAP